MDYDEFKHAWDAALNESKLRRQSPWSDETIELRGFDRIYKVYVEPMGGQDAEPFYVAAELSWRWDALLTARMRSREEDVLVELLGRPKAETTKTAPATIRVDMILHATLPFGKGMKMPPHSVWSAWSREVTARLDAIEPILPEEVVREERNGMLAILAWQGDPELDVKCSPTGELKLEGVSVSCWQGITVPRVWDNEKRRADKHPHSELAEMFGRVRAALHAWMECTDHLRRAAR